MRIDNYFTKIAKINKKFEDSTQKFVYKQHIKILGASMISPTEVIQICNDQSEIFKASSKVQSLNLETNQSTLLREIPYQNSSFEILKTVYYDSYSVRAINSSAEYTATDDNIINCVCESQTSEYYVIVLNNKIILLNQQLQPLQEINEIETSDKKPKKVKFSANFILNVSTTSICDQFIIYIGENKLSFVLFELQNGLLQQIITKYNKDLFNVEPSFQVDSHDVKQMCFAHGVFNSFQTLCLYCNYGSYGNINKGHYTNTVSCYNFNSNKIDYIYPCMAPVLRMCSSSYLFEVGDLLFDLFCYADAIGFLHLTFGCVNVGYSRIFSIQTNMWVKNISFSFTEVEDNGTHMVKRDNFLNEEDKLVDVQVQSELKIFIFGSTELVNQDKIIQADGFSIIHVNLNSIQQIADANRCVQIDSKDDSEEFSYVDHKIEPSQEYTSHDMNNSESHKIAQDKSENEAWEEVQIENQNEKQNKTPENRTAQQDIQVENKQDEIYSITDSTSEQSNNYQESSLQYKYLFEDLTKQNFNDSFSKTQIKNQETQKVKIDVRCELYPNIEMQSQIKTKQTKQEYLLKYLLKDGSELKLLQIYKQQKLVIMIHQNTQIIFVHKPDYILIMDDQYYVAIDNELIIYNSTGLEIDKVQFRDSIKLIFGQNQVFSSSQMVFELNRSPYLFALTESQIIELNSKQCKEIQFNFDHFSVFSETSNIFIQFEHKIYLLYDKPQLISDYGFLQQLSTPQQFAFSLKSSVIPQLLYSLAHKQIPIKELNNITEQIINLNQIERFTFLRMVIEQAENERKYLQNKQFYNSAVQELKNAFKEFDEDVQKIVVQFGKLKRIF
ncbi:Conserved_hypothetical protein [Hexamita inflata]|uniref:Uncharacterized protein n=1 Tax=Hexamita inflata TaxID=28002 RepID=A0AA86PJD8_9EUKA|nr:Conserved hypothetical protein [Hexamita inflata]CAI9940830.1 Conserved hypothetical protein [Hexamita inflata]